MVQTVNVMTFTNISFKRIYLIIIINILSNVNCIWPPQYEVNLEYEEEFVISELLDRSDVQDIYDEEELIREEDLKTLKLHESYAKYFRLHELSKRRNMEIKPDDDLLIQNPDSNPQQIFPEFNPHLDEPKPWIAGFVDESNNIVKDEDTIYFDDEAKSNNTHTENLEKRKAENETADSEYNYENLKAQYDDAMKKAESNNDTLKYKDVKEEETPKEVVQSLVDVAPKNCTDEEKSGMGVGTIRCFWIESRHKHLSKNKKYYMLKKVILILLIWVFVYIVIAVPLWCQYGWGCCCCRCKFCRPRDEIEEIKTFFTNNPPGIYHDEKGTLKKYKASSYEIYAHKNLEKAIQRL